MKIAFTLISLLVLSLQAFTQVELIRTEKIKILDTLTIANSAPEYPFDKLGPIKKGKSGLLSYTPNGAHFKNPTPDCDHINLSSIIDSAIGTHNQLNNEMQNWLYNCNSQLKKYAPLFSLTRFQGLYYRLSNNPYVYQIEFTLKNGDKLRALLAIKDTAKARPLVISKCGIYCDAIDTPTTNDTLMHLFDEGPFNVLILASTSGYQFAKANQASALGGFIEGDQMLQVAELLMDKDSLFKNLISDIHLHGIS